LKVRVNDCVEHGVFEDPTLPALQRIRRYLRSSGRYGPSPFLVGHYGGFGEIAQGFCRTSAVSGSTYILGRTISSLRSRSDDDASPSHSTSNQRRHNITLQGLDEIISCDLVIFSPDHIHSTTDTAKGEAPALARCIAIIDQPLVFSSFDSEPQQEQGDPQEETSNSFAMDTAVLIFPPLCLAECPTDTAVHAFVTGEGSMSAPRSKCTRLASE
jgi:Rab proteins geranylgeranyltransferase component A